MKLPQRQALLTLAPAFAVLAANAAIEYAMGRNPLCPCGHTLLFDPRANSPENSQHLSDWYSLSHIIHGFVFFGLLWLVARRWPLGLRLLVATIIECAWELLENSTYVIERYRTTTSSSSYNGDSILNSVSDVACMMLGFWLASRLPWKVIVPLAIAMEILALTVIRDNLTLNVIMLLHPVEAIRQWRAGA